MHSQLLSRVQLFVAPWTIDDQAPLSEEFSRQIYWSGLPFLLQGIFLTQDHTPGLPGLAGGFFTTEPSGRPGQQDTLM